MTLAFMAVISILFGFLLPQAGGHAPESFIPPAELSSGVCPVWHWTHHPNASNPVSSTINLQANCTSGREIRALMEVCDPARCFARAGAWVSRTGQRSTTSDRIWIESFLRVSSQTR